MQSRFNKVIPFLLITLILVACNPANSGNSPLSSLPPGLTRHNHRERSSSILKTTQNPTGNLASTPNAIQPTHRLPTSTPTPTPSPIQIEIFEKLWNLVNREYLYSDFNGLDWGEIYEEYRSKITAELSNDGFYRLMNEMLTRLEDGHSVFLDPNQVADENAQFAGLNDYVGIGVFLASVPERDRAVILVTMRGSPAEKAGLKPRDSILMVDGEPVLDDNGELRDIIGGPEGTKVTLTVQSPNKKPRRVTIERQQIRSNIRLPFRFLTTPGGKKVGYVLLVTFADETIDDQIEAVLTLMRINGVSDGLIVDNRMNEGGAENVLANTLSYFTRGTLGYFVGRETYRPLNIGIGRNINNSQEIPLVVLTGPMTASYGEIFAGTLKNIQRAYLIGERTKGNIETIWGYNFKDGSRAWIAHDTFSPIFHPEQDWESNGIFPDKTVVVNWEEVSLEQDLAVFAASDYIDKIHRMVAISRSDIILPGIGKTRINSPR